MSDNRSTATKSPDAAGHRNYGLRGLQLLPVAEPDRGDGAGRAVVRILLRPSEWMLTVRPQGQRVPRTTPANLTGPYVPPLPGRFAIVLVTGPLGPGPGRAVLHYQQGHTSVYCREDHMENLAACVLPGLAEQAISYATDPEARITVTRISYQQFLGGPLSGEELLADAEQSLAGSLHPAYAAILRRRDVTLRVCSDLISAGLAEDLSLLWTAHARCLSQLGQHRRRPRSRCQCRPPARLLPDPARPSRPGTREPIKPQASALTATVPAAHRGASIYRAVSAGSIETIGQVSSTTRHGVHQERRAGTAAGAPEVPGRSNNAAPGLPRPPRRY